MIYGFSLTSALAIYFVMWWIVLFAVLPFGVRTQQDAGVVVPGSPASAPERPRLARTIIATTVVSAVLFAMFLALVNSGLSLDDIPLPGYPR